MAGSIAEEITRLQGTLENCKSAVKAKGGTISEQAGFSALPEAIRTLSGDGSVIYESYVDNEESLYKTVPERSTGFAYLKSIGGRSFKDTELNGNLIPYPYVSIEIPWGEIEVSEGAEKGSLVYTAITPDESIGTATFYLNTEEFYLYPGKTYYYGGPQGNNYVVGRDVNGNEYSVFLNDSFSVEKTLIVNKIIFEIYCQEGDTGKVSPLICENADKGFVPRWEGLRHAKVKRISVTGKNILPFPYYSGGAGEIISANGISFTIQTDGSIARRGTAEKLTTFVIAMSNPFDAGVSYVIGPKLILKYTDSTGNAKYISGGYGKSSVIVWKNNYTFGQLYIQINTGATVDDVVYPIVNQGETGLAYEPFFKRVIELPAELTNDEYWGCGINEHSYNKYDLETGTYHKEFNDVYGQEDESQTIRIANGVDPVIEVTPGGRITFENEYALPVKSEIQYELYTE